VQFQIDGANWGDPVSLVNGSATSASISTLAIGQHTISATYSGDRNFLGVTPQAGWGVALNVAPTYQQFESALESTIMSKVSSFEQLAVSDEVADEIAYPALDQGLINDRAVIDVVLTYLVKDVSNYNSDIANNKNDQAFQDMVQVLKDMQVVGAALLGEALYVETHYLPGSGAYALLGTIAGGVLIQDLQNLGGLKEISWGFLVYIAVASKVSNPPSSTPTVWTTGILGPGDSGGLLGSTTQNSLTGYSSIDMSNSNMNHYYDSLTGAIGQSGAWYDAAQQISPGQGLTEYGGFSLGGGDPPDEVKY
jgi:hypothetical protein